MTFEHIVELPRLEHDVSAPCAESTLLIDGIHPERERLPLHAILFRVLALDLQNELPFVRFEGPLKDLRPPL